jgi:hypothetical protein
VPVKGGLEQSAKHIVKGEINPVQGGGGIQKDRNLKLAVIHSGQIGRGKLQQHLLHLPFFDPSQSPNEKEQKGAGQGKPCGQGKGKVKQGAQKTMESSIPQGNQNPC